MYSAFNSTADISIVQLVQLVFDNWKVSIITSQKYLLGKWPRSLFRKPHKHHATFTLFPKSNILDSIQIAIFSRRLADSRRGLIDASHLGSHAGLSKN